MRLFFKFYFSSLVTFLILTGCQDSTPLPAPYRNGLIQVIQNDSLSVWATEADRQAAQDVHAAIQSYSEEICASLQTQCRFPVTVELYPDQAGFDRHVINPEMRGFFAISGPPHTIQMVSPANPAPHAISYEDGVAVSVHEFAHLALDEINPGMPTWLDEGTAIFVGPHAPYTVVCQEKFPFEYIPSLQRLEEDYNGIPAPDLFAYTAVDYIVHEYGIEKLNLLLRTPEAMEDILGVSKGMFEEGWQNFMRDQYHNNQTKESPEP
jgi:RNA polymerase sigma-70 factor (ECF subfamily)